MTLSCGCEDEHNTACKSLFKQKPSDKIKKLSVFRCTICDQRAFAPTHVCADGSISFSKGNDATSS